MKKFLFAIGLVSSVALGSGFFGGGGGGGGGTPSIGGGITGGTLGSILFVNPGGTLSQNNTNLFWDPTNFRLGIGTNTPGQTFHLLGSARFESLGTGIAHFGSTGILSSSLLVDADVSASAAIAYSKLNLALGIVNGDISTSAAIARSKIATGSNNHVVINDGSGNLSSEARLALSRFADGATSGLPLLASGTGVDSAYGALSISGAAVTGTLPLNKGGTNASLAASNGAVAFSNASALALTAVGSSGQLLASAGAGTPVWTTPTYPTASPTNGQIPIGNGTNFVAAAITGTTNRVTVTNGGGTITLTGPQDIHSGASPSFTSETLTGSLRLTPATDSTTTGANASLAAFTAGTVRLTNASLASIDMIPAGTTGQFLTLQNVVGARVLLNDETGATAANRIRTGVGDSIEIPNNASVTLTYDGTSSRWRVVNASPVATTTKGDISAYSTSSMRLPVGVNNQRLIADSNQTAGLRYQDNDIQNYVLNKDFEVGTEQWATYADAAGVAPVDGTGGVPTVTLTRSTTTPIRGVGMGVITKDAANRQGEGASYAFSIDRADQAKVLSVSFDYIVGSGTFAAGSDSTTGDINVYIYDVTNAVVIQPAGYKLSCSSTTTYCKQIATFQTSSNSTSYRLIFHVASTSTSAFTLNIDNIFVGPQAIQYGAPISEWVTFTPTGTWSTNTTYTGRWRRVGDSMDIQVNLALTGAPTATPLQINMPTGYTIDSSKLPATTITVLGQAETLRAAVNVFTGTVDYASTTVVSVNVQNASATYLTSANTTATVPATFASGDAVYAFWRVPIVGWGSSVQMSNDTDTRVVAAKITATPSTGTVTSSYSTTVFGTVSKDTHGGYNSTTGVYTVPVSGWYKTSAVIWLAATQALNNTTNIKILKNNATTVAVKQYVSGGSVTVPQGLDISGGDFYNAGDDIRIQTASNATSPAYSGADSSSLIIERISGPSTIAATETVAYSGSRNSGATAVATATAVTIVANATTKDTHSAYNTSTGVYTVPVSGWYEVKASLEFAAGAINTSREILLSVNGTANKRISYTTVATATTSYVPIGSTLDYYKAGDTIAIQAFQGSGSTLNVGTSGSNYNWFTIQRTGN